MHLFVAVWRQRPATNISFFIASHAQRQLLNAAQALIKETGQINSNDESMGVTSQRPLRKQSCLSVNVGLQTKIQMQEASLAVPKNNLCLLSTTLYSI